MNIKQQLGKAKFILYIRSDIWTHEAGVIPSDTFMIFMFHIQVVIQLAVIGQHC